MIGGVHMLKKIFFFLISLITLHSYCMNKDKEEPQQLVKDAKEIEVRIIRDDIKVFIDSKTSISQLKERLASAKKILPNRLSLFVIYSIPMKGWAMYQNSPKLTDNQNIQEIITKYNSSRFVAAISTNE
jgi:hypothetical protein